MAVCKTSKVKQTTAMGKVFLHYVDFHSMCTSQIFFVHEGNRLTPKKIVREHGIEDGDVIDAVLLQTGD